MNRLQVLVIFAAFGQIIGDLSGDILRAVSSNDVGEVGSIIDQNRDSLGSFINTREAGSGQTPLMKSILMGHTDMVRMLLMLPEVDVSLGEKDGYTAFHGAGFQGRAEIAKLLLEDSRNIEFEKWSKPSPKNIQFIVKKNIIPTIRGHVKSA